jgi:hypothetical protein
LQVGEEVRQGHKWNLCVRRTTESKIRDRMMLKDKPDKDDMNKDKPDKDDMNKNETGEQVGGGGGR